MTHNLKINRHDGHSIESADRLSSWMEQFLDTYAKKENVTAVEVARKRSEPSIADQIYSILHGNGHPKGTVESVVKEMQERTGLKEYLKRYAQVQPDGNQLFPNVNSTIRNSILTFIKNRIAAHHGLISVPAMQYEILSVFRREGLQSKDVNNDEVAKYISDCIIQEQQANPTKPEDIFNLGKGIGLDNMDTSDNSDFMKGLMPATS